MNEVTTIVIDANPLWRDGLRAILAEGDLTVVREVARAADLLPHGDGAEAPDLIVTDCGGDPGRARQQLNELRTAFPDSKLVVLTANDDPGFLIACFGAPIDGLVSKSVSSRALLRSLQLILAGERVFPAQLVSMLLAHSGGWSERASTPAAAHPALSQREAQILQCLVAGDSNKAIANRLKVTEATVKVHLKSILRKIQVRNRTQAAIWAINHGMGADPREQPAPTGNSDDRSGRRRGPGDM
jgi:two-component system nitrate/nitrite response regulator NarL